MSADEAFLPVVDDEIITTVKALRGQIEDVRYEEGRLFISVRWQGDMCEAERQVARETVLEMLRDRLPEDTPVEMEEINVSSEFLEEIRKFLR